MKSNATNVDQAEGRRTIEDAVATVLATMRDEQDRAARWEQREHPETWIAEALERRPRILIAILDERSTEAWLLERNQVPGAEVALHASVAHLNEALTLPGHDHPISDSGSAESVYGTKAMADVLDAIDWLRKDTGLL